MATRVGAVGEQGSVDSWWTMTWPLHLDRRRRPSSVEYRAADKNSFIRLAGQPDTSDNRMETPTIKLTMPGRAESLRLAMVLSGIPFQDERIRHDDWPNMKPKTLFGALPEMTIDGVQFAQTNALLRYVAHIGGLEPSAALDRLRVDQIVDGVGDVIAAIEPTLHEEDRGKKMSIRKDLVDTPYLRGLDYLVGQNSVEGHSCGDKVTMADLSIWTVTQWFRLGVLNGIPTDVVDAYPNLAKVVKAVDHHPRVIEWRQAHPLKK
ncbi:unnamed protein product (mitochondrion) [Plasmodiophora brassicae]|uniref:Glutathione transferase n=2 Tax=Plasmodiophora brassicae TaxID=37360 RepID=A0A3P3YBB2_PLABS|nr:unnamed protein product [Plasmodiophora brassicae]